MSSELVALNANWLDINGTADPVPTSTVGNATGMAVDACTGGNVVASNSLWYSGSCWPPYSHSWLTITSDRRPVRLGYSEVERLRAAAKRDAKLKKILQKFTDLIEVVVDFE